MIISLKTFAAFAENEFSPLNNRYDCVRLGKIMFPSKLLATFATVENVGRRRCYFWQIRPEYQPNVVLFSEKLNGKNTELQLEVNCKKLPN